MPMSALPLPATPDEITPVWLTAALREGGLLTGAAVSQASWEIIGEEQGFTGVVARIQLQYDGAGRGEVAPSSLIAKLPMAQRSTPSTYREAQQQSQAALRRHYERCVREVRFYEEIAPLSKVPAPRLYYGAGDEATGRVVLLLEDVRTARAGDVLLGCSVGEAALVFQAMAPFHARWWLHPRPGCFPWILRWAGDYQARQKRYNAQVPLFLERFEEQVPAFVRDLVNQLRFHYAAVLKKLDEAPATLIHADLHLDNILFHPPDIEPAITVLDWQGVSRGAAAVDFTQFAFGALSVDERRAAGDLLRDYHALLVEQGVPGYTLPQFREHCRLALLWQLAGTVGWLSSVNLGQLAGRERALVEAALGDGRLLAALEDYAVGALLRG
jgi:aminoglycoside phosphotransferase (APT) family kinase protein